MTDAPDVRGIMRALARLELRMLEVIKGVDGIKGELRTLTPRIDTLTAEVREAARRVHQQANAIQKLLHEATELVEDAEPNAWAHDSDPEKG
jgi:uncharacterized coiled-coil DUF342 family protein